MRGLFRLPFLPIFQTSLGWGAQPQTPQGQLPLIYICTWHYYLFIYLLFIIITYYLFYWIKEIEVITITVAVSLSKLCHN